MKLTQKPSGIWRVDFLDPKTGARRRESTRTRDKTEANRIAAKLIAGDDPFAKPEAFPKPSPVATPVKLTVETATMNDLFNHCRATIWSPTRLKSQATLRSNLKVLTSLVGKTRVRDMTQQELVALANSLWGLGYKAATVKRKMDCVGRAITEAQDWMIDGRPVLTGRPRFPKVEQKDKNQRRNLTEAEEEALFQMIDRRIDLQPMVDWQRYRMLVRFLLDTGMRLGEALAAEPRWFHAESGVWMAHIPASVTKSQKARIIPLTKAVIAMLPVLETSAVGGKLFPYKAATVWQRFNSLRLDVAEHTKQNIDDVVVHSLRHTCLTRLARKHPMHMVSKWAGHSSVTITESFYVHLTGNDLVGMADALQAPD
ncbi:site-specific integrase [Brevundimonas diminuta]|uniref:tyrosine-type recombinase/integrase n=1 Tax=Brevundimonas diminuta TaxID=293 RepID=UPI0019049626|nr:site-specific integrase [Brevundimonas diminuta]MBK1968437.1 site-specific integrase [Brevundimonas diminuta]